MLQSLAKTSPRLFQHFGYLETSGQSSSLKATGYKGYNLSIYCLLNIFYRKDYKTPSKVRPIEKVSLVPFGGNILEMSWWRKISFGESFRSFFSLGQMTMLLEMIDFSQPKLKHFFGVCCYILFPSIVYLSWLDHSQKVLRCSRYQLSYSLDSAHLYCFSRFFLNLTSSPLSFECGPFYPPYCVF